ncbi:ABC transporter ATP-binding protein [Pinisolibacter aquiterrae]|uniref:ABC transporter ATP-binding protein n=1 Tax=Pinisolibacter aquiterrae TaxID=2815579 RepID=UPI001C3E366B|nr:ABC transporter ATP-binding protein [Pinisolibacter aquiterrae]MBV5265423.1 ABC transporter ATP-binding protein [Pinisolibacter aquiterrae]MCC8236056.1 ABC transporter ATP-binding protein [Pinisolibacter aquiterrae]
MTRAPLLLVDGLSVAFPTATPVRDVGFTVGEGETVALVGESGSGKSLVASSLLRLLPAGGRIVGGAVRFEGTDVTRSTEAELTHLRGRRIAMVFQEPATALDPVMTIGRQVAEVIEWHEGASRRAARARAIELLDLVRLPDPSRRVDSYPHELSGGQRQRVMIAMAIACRPKLVVADEPTTALDVTIQAQVLELLDRLRRELSMGVLLISHDLGVVGQWADRVVVLYAGRKLEELPAERLFDGARHPYTRGLLAASPRPSALGADGLLTEIPGQIDGADRLPGCPFSPRCALARPSCDDRMPDLVAVGPEHTVACPVAPRGGIADAVAVGR